MVLLFEYCLTGKIILLSNFRQKLGLGAPRFFPEAWSLSVEEWFYLLFPLVTVVLVKCKLGPVSAYLASGAFLLIFSTMLRFVCVFIEPSLNWDSGIRKVVIFRFDSLMFGICLSWFIGYVNSINQRRLSFLFGLSALLVSMAAYFSLDYDGSYFLKTIGFSITSIGFALIIPYMLDFRFAERNIVGRFFKKTALWSYSMYLSNFLLYSIIQKSIFSEYSLGHIWACVFFCILLLVLSCYTVSAAIYKMYELPIMKLRKNVILNKISI